MTRHRATAAAWLLAWGAGTAFAGVPPAGFVESTVASGLSAPTAIGHEPGSNALWIVEQGSGSAPGTFRVRRRNPVSGAIMTALTMQCVDARAESGGLGIAFDPDFAEPIAPVRAVYLYYSRYVDAAGCADAPLAPGTYNRVSRFLVASDDSLTGERVLLTGPRLEGGGYHNGGALQFLPDETLLVAMGDDHSRGAAIPGARNLSELRGKLLRIRRDGTVPADNPFAGQAGVRPEIWAWGLRNPFRFRIDPATGVPLIGDVGQNAWEEIDFGEPGADYGYPCYEGDAAFQLCDPAPDPGTLRFPALVYGHPGQSTPYSGYAVIGGPVYRSGSFPDEYRDRYYFADYVSGWIRSAKVGPGRTLSDVRLFVDNAGNPVDIVVGPAGCLTYADRGAGEVREVCWAGTPNAQPNAVASAAPTSGLAPLDVQFAGSQSSDPDGDPLAYAWTFGDSTGSAQPDPAKTYAQNGVYAASLRVDDGRGAANSTAISAPLTIVVGNRVPVPVISDPADGSGYDAGQTIAFAGSATDPDDGPLSTAALSWTIAFHHGEHAHPFLGPIQEVASGSFTIPDVGEDATNVWYRIHLAAVDSGSGLGAAGYLTGTASVDIVPNLSAIEVAASPPGAGLRLEIDGSRAAAPFGKTSVVGFKRAVQAPSPQVIGGVRYTFQSWSDGGDAFHVVSVPAAPTTYTATFSACPPDCPPNDADADGVHDGLDNCSEVANPGQADFDGDGFGDACETGAALADADLSGRVDGFDLARLGLAFGSVQGGPGYDTTVDLDRDGDVDGHDLAIMAADFGES